MKLFQLFFGLFSFVCGAYSDECEENAKACMKPLMMINCLQINCTLLKDTKRCFQDLVGRCLEDDDRAKIDEYLNELAGGINICGRDEGMTRRGYEVLEDWNEQEVMDCVKEYVRERSTTNTCIQDILRSMNPPETGGGDINLKCEFALRLIDCVEIEIGKLCGNVNRAPFQDGRLLGIEDMVNFVKSQHCVSIIRINDLLDHAYAEIERNREMLV